MILHGNNSTHDHTCAACLPGLGKKIERPTRTFNGSEIPEAIRKRIFDVFFTTKTPGKAGNIGENKSDNPAHQAGPRSF
ncbi:ATP-binding protein [Desulfonatronum thioautotrophicum]|uniref:ATP-binding protein n=1 Tax=Desulfonatronum thioautotrophicum TaxID=617001 RepID=UPI0005EB09E5|nr:ATP-binding protein [Desulfonatronum thioautotrophicum]